MSVLSKTTGFAVAAAAAALMMGGMVSSAQAGEGVKCVGANSCKGTTECATAENQCKGQNSCKGKGWISAKSEEDCTKAGGKVSK